MKKHFKLVLLVVLFACYCIPSWAQVPSTEGQDFWVTFLRASERDGGPDTLKLTISAKEACTVTIQQPGIAQDIVFSVGDNSSTEISTNGGPGGQTIQENKCYSMNSENVTQTAIHITATKDISLFAGNFRDMSFDAANILPTSALLDNYLIQTYPPSDHENKPQGSHFAIVAVEDNTIVDYTLTATTNGGKSGKQTTPTLKKGDVWYVWSGNKEGDDADFSGTSVTARDNKKIAVFQGCPHTNIPYKVRDRDHIYSQAMPIAYWGTEFGITASRKHRRDIIAVMAINDGTEVYINAQDGGKQLVHTFDFSKDKKHYWTFEIGEELAYCADKDQTKKLAAPLVADSSCYISTSCPAGVHLFMVSNRYDNLTESVSADTLVSDPAMLWISPIEQVIKEINFSTYHTEYKHDGKPAGTKFHFMNIITTTDNVPKMTWNGNNISQYFHPLRGNNEYSFARIEIPRGNHNLKGETGFLAHVYGYGWRESYAYSCGSSTVQRSITFNGTPLMIDSIAPGKFCVNEPIEMKLRIGNNNYQSVVWDFGDGISENGGSSITHTYNAPGWYDLTVSAEYINSCTNQKYNEDYSLTFRVWKHDTVIVEPEKICLDTTTWQNIVATYGQDSLDNLLAAPKKTILNPDTDCYVDRQLSVVTYGLETTRTVTAEDYDSVWVHDRWYYSDKEPKLPADGIITWIEEKANEYFCDIHVTCYAHIITCLKIDIPNKPEQQEVCLGEDISIPYEKFKGDIDQNQFIFTINEIPSYKETLPLSNANISGTINLPLDAIKKPGHYTGKIHIDDLYCTDQPKDETINFTVLYPSDIFQYKFNNVLAVYKPGSGGNTGYEFNAYQWYRNGVAIPGATESVLYLGQGITFNKGDIVLVELTDKSGMTLKSCPQTIEKVDDYDAAKNNAPRKILQDQRIRILRDGKVYDMYGQKVK